MDTGTQVQLKPDAYHAQCQSGVVGLQGTYQTDEVAHVDYHLDVHDAKNNIIEQDVSNVHTVPKQPIYDVEIQVGTTTITGIVQTESVAVPLIHRKQHAEHIPLATDSTLQSDDTIEVDVVAPVQTTRPETPKEDMATQVLLKPDAFDAECQSGALTQPGAYQTDQVSNVELIDYYLESVQPLQEVQAQTTLAVQTDIGKIPHDVELQVGTLTNTAVAQTDIASVSVANKKLQITFTQSAVDTIIHTQDIMDVDIVAPVHMARVLTPKENMAIQVMFKSILHDAQCQSETETVDTSFQTDTPIAMETFECQLNAIKEDVETSTVSVQASIEKTLYDVEIQIGTNMDIATSQTESPEVPLINRKLHVIHTQPATDTNMQSEELVEQDIVTPIETIRPSIPKAESASQVLLEPMTYDAECQSGVTASTATCQTDDVSRPVRFDYKVDIEEPKISIPEQHNNSTQTILEKQYDVELQIGTTMDIATSQTESAEVPLINRKLHAFFRTPATDSTLQSEDMMEVDIVAPVHTSRLEYTRMDTGTQVQLKPDAYHTQCQSKPLAFDDAHQTSSPVLIETFECQLEAIEFAPSSQVNCDVSVQVSVQKVLYDVEMQIGTSVDSTISQTDQFEVPLINRKLHVLCSSTPAKDSMLQSEDMLEMAVIAPVQTSLPVVSTIDTATQVVLKPDAYDAECQSGIVSSVGIVQTDEITQIDYQLGIQEAMSSMIDRDVSNVQSIIKKTIYDVELQIGTTMDTESSQTGTVELPLINQGLNALHRLPGTDSTLQSKDMIEVDVFAPVQTIHVGPHREDMATQVLLKPDTYDVECQSGVVALQTAFQTEEPPIFRSNDYQLDVQDTKIITAEQEDRSVQVLFQKDFSDVESQVDRTTCGQISQTESSELTLIDYNVHASYLPTGRDGSLQLEQQTEVDLVAPIQMARPVINKESVTLQVLVKPEMSDADCQSGVIATSNSMQTDEIAHVRPTDFQIGVEEKFANGCDADVQVKSQMYDVELQIATSTDTGTSQTEAYEKPLINRKLHAICNPTAIDINLESDDMIEVDVVAPVQTILPDISKEDISTQVLLKPDVLDVECQSDVVFAQGAYQIDETCRSNYQADIRKSKSDMIERDVSNLFTVPKQPVYDVELQIGTTVDTGTSQTEFNEIPLIPSRMHDALTPPAIDSNMQSEDMIEVDVVTQIQAPRSVTLKEDATAQVHLKPAVNDAGCQSSVVASSVSFQTDGNPITRSVDYMVDAEPHQFIQNLYDAQVYSEKAIYDVELQVGTSTSIGASQTELAVMVDHKLDAEHLPPARDSRLQSEDTVEVDVVAPVHRARPFAAKSDFGTQTEIKSDVSDIECQLGIVTLNADCQTDEVQIINKKLQVFMGQEKVNKKSQTGSEQQPYLPKDLVMETTAESPLITFNVEAQLSVMTDEKNTQTEIYAMKETRLSDVTIHLISPGPTDLSLQTDAPLEMDLVGKLEVTPPLINSEMQLQLQKEEPPVMFDVEAQLSPEFSNTSVQTDFERILDTTLQAQIPAKGKLIQTAEPPAMLDVELQLGMITNDEITQTDIEREIGVPLIDTMIQCISAKPININLETQTLLDLDHVKSFETPPPLVISEVQIPQKEEPQFKFDVESQLCPITDEQSIQTDQILIFDVELQLSSEADTKKVGTKLKLTDIAIQAVPEYVLDTNLQADTASEGKIIQTAEPPAMLDVELQLGIITNDEIIQTDIKSEVEVLLTDTMVKVQSIKSVDVNLESEALLDEDLVQCIEVSPVQAKSEVQLPNREQPQFKFDVESQLCPITDEQSIQTDQILMFDVELQLSYEESTKSEQSVPLTEATVRHHEDASSRTQVEQAKVMTLEKSLQTTMYPLIHDVEIQLGVNQSASSAQTNVITQESTLISRESAGISFMEQIAVAPLKYDVELETGIVGLTTASQTALSVMCSTQTNYPEKQDVISMYSTTKEQRAKVSHDISIQTEQVDTRYDVQMETGFVQYDAEIQTTHVSTEPNMSNKKIQVSAAKISTVDTDVQFDEKNSVLYDVYVETGIVPSTTLSQTDLETIELVDNYTNTEIQEDLLDLVAPVVKARPIDDQPNVCSVCSGRLRSTTDRQVDPKYDMEISDDYISQILPETDGHMTESTHDLITVHVSYNPIVCDKVVHERVSPLALRPIESEPPMLNTAQINQSRQIDMPDHKPQLVNKKVQSHLKLSDGACQVTLQSADIWTPVRIDQQTEARPQMLNKKMVVDLLKPGTHSFTTSLKRIPGFDFVVDTSDENVIEDVWTQYNTEFVGTDTTPIVGQAGFEINVDESIEYSKDQTNTGQPNISPPAYVTKVIQIGDSFLDEQPIIPIEQVRRLAGAPLSETVDAECQCDAPTTKGMPITKSLQLTIPTMTFASQTSTGTETKVKTRNVRIQKGTSQLRSDAMTAGEILDTTESFIVHQSLYASTPSMIYRPLGSRLRLDKVHWGVQCTPPTMTGMTQTSDLSRTEYGSDLSVPPVIRTSSTATTGVQTDLDDHYVIKRVVTTIKRGAGGVSSYTRTTPVVQGAQIGGPSLLNLSLPSNLDEQFFDGDDGDDQEGSGFEFLEGASTHRVTNIEADQSHKVIHEGVSMKNAIPHLDYRSQADLYDTGPFIVPDPSETVMNANVEQCFQHVLKSWGTSYLMHRLSRPKPSLSIEYDDLSSPASSQSRLIEARTQYSVGETHLYPTVRLSSSGTQTSEPHLRPPHRNKRIQRGPSYVSWTPNQSTVVDGKQEDVHTEIHPSQLSYQQTISHSAHMSTISEELQHASLTGAQMGSSGDRFVCTQCGAQRTLPSWTERTSISLPITQLHDVRTQTKTSGYCTLENDRCTLPLYMNENEVRQIKPEYVTSEDAVHSKITWYANLTTSGVQLIEPNEDELWIDTPGRLLEMQINNVRVPGSDERISAAEAFYRGILRVVYWDSQSPSSALGSAIPIAEAVHTNAVSLSEQIYSGQVNLHTIWTSPEAQRQRYIVHGIRPEASDTDVVYNVASAIRAGVIDEETGHIRLDKFHQSAESWTFFPGRSNLISVQEAISRGLIESELIESNIASQTPSLQDVDV